ncbi:MAG: 4-hydroxy-tetrahydrodipicolinate synthase [Spirochaetales bacterium]|nr:4-hydroxy-tetrahydrodipicolinate synthase [Spirochaetales bacterium]
MRAMMEGLGVAIATPFNDRGGLDIEAFDRLLAFLCGDAFEPAAGKYAEQTFRSQERYLAFRSFWEAESGGADFIVVLGSTGEGATIEPYERRLLLERAVAASHGRPIVAGTGSNSTATCVRLTREAVELGADAVLVVVPYYNKPNPDGLVAHFSAAAEAAEGKPVIVYNVPGRTGLNLTPAVLDRLWRIDGITAVKESSGNLAQIGEICRTLPEGKLVFSGDDALALPSIAVGAEGLVSVAANVLPRRCKALVDAAREGKRDTARKLHASLLPFMDALFIESNPIPLKAALGLTGLCGEMVRLPLAPASQATKDCLKASLSMLGVQVS